MDLDIKNKYALVTGGSHGIGRSIALGLADEGCNVAICARGMPNINATVQDIESRGVKAVGIYMDALDTNTVKLAWDKVIADFGNMHILINNVGGGGRWGEESVEETKESVWSDVYKKNVDVTIKLTLKSLFFMKKNKWGRIVTISSVLGKEGGGRPWFTMAKSAQISFMKSLSKMTDLVRCGITFNTVAPGAIMIPDTGWEDQNKEDPEGFRNKIYREFPLGRLGTTEEVASAVIFLCSSKASLINGACLVVDGGESMAF